ncbi:DUF4386 domain-containing protein [Nocardiopsis sp. RSe5-2]|uniref:DUF4386 domain-containing protein n=1 Tax=Nocardiopsis endophytica TaxID=3018445 RepID=A0ABT4U3W5_9ACTN|nr:DUF4386 domain-containing protein [Nocardiopsis endophytica]MDA2811649.1 DUF4386 domain-containing protein [Nocardiopsis endophytica]
MYAPPASARTLRAPSLTAGLALLLMGVLGVFGSVVVLQGLVAPGDADRTAAGIAASEPLFRAGVAAMLAVAVLDIVVAAALYSLFESVNRAVATAAAWFRVAYAAVLAASTGHLALALDHLDDPERMLAATEAFDSVWGLGLGVFGVHLLVLGWLAVKADFIHTAFGVLLAAAGTGYLADALGPILFSGYAFQAALFTFVGEIALIVWLLTRGPRVVLPARAHAPSAEAASGEALSG